MINSLPEPKRFAQSWENWAVVLILGLVATVQFHAVVHGGSIGQDFGMHTRDVRNAANEPIKWLFGSFPRISPPLYHWLVSFIFRLCEGKGWIVATGFISALVNVATLWMLHRICREVISDAVIRVATLAFISFLPVSLITPVVLATDALNQLPFVGLLRSRLVGEATNQLANGSGSLSTLHRSPRRHQICCTRTGSERATSCSCEHRHLWS
ncbi:MAG TPA: hypothetical protein VKC60_02525 [Opitutaceae bacterium]|nr:hypothetical protein [Opitutaceae bacterium]